MNSFAVLVACGASLAANMRFLAQQLEKLGDKFEKRLGELDDKFEKRLIDQLGKLDDKFENKFERLIDQLQTSVPSFLRAPELQAAVIENAASGTWTGVRVGSKLFAASCVHEGLFIDPLDHSLRLRLPEAIAADQVVSAVVRDAAILVDLSRGEGDCLFVEVSSLPSSVRPMDLSCDLLPPVANEMLCGSSPHGQCHGSVETIRGSISILNGVASPGTSGSLLCDRWRRPRAMLAGIDPESTPLPVQLTDVFHFSVALTRAQDAKRYAAVPLISHQALKDAVDAVQVKCLGDLDGPTRLRFDSTGRALLPKSCAGERLVSDFGQVLYGAALR